MVNPQRSGVRKRNPPVFMRLDSTGEVRARHFATKRRGHPMAKCYWKAGRGAMGIF